MPLEMFALGLDLGQMHDYSALCAVRRRDPDEGVGEPTFSLEHLDRWRAEPYTAVPGRVAPVIAAIHAQQPDAAVDLVVDATGVGRAVVDVLRTAALKPIAVTITGGIDQIAAGHREWRTPKRDLVAIIAVLLQQRRLRIAAALPLATVLTEELQNFKCTMTAGGHDRYGAGGDALEWREKAHDDLVLSVALAVWWADRARPLGTACVPMLVGDSLFGVDSPPVPDWTPAGYPGDGWGRRW